MNKAAALVLTAGLSALTAHAQDSDLPSKEEMWKLIQQQQEQIQTLNDRLGITEEKVEEADQKIEATSAFVEEASRDNRASGNAWFNKTQLGGYGELHYNGGQNDQIDFHRFVLFIGHDFSDSVRFFSEVEIEHSLSGDGKPGEVELEQAYIEFDLNENSKAKAGLFLLPVGLLNETHEPNTFYGVERNNVEKNIIPTTWWEAGAAYNREFDNGLSLDVALHSGLNVATSGSSAFNIRSGRQKVAEAEASDGAITTRLNWTAIPGIKLGGSIQYQDDIAQGSFSETVGATLVELHADIQKGPFALRALYAQWDLDGSAATALGADEQLGYYIEPSYKISTDNGDFGFFARYSAYDNTAGRGSDSENAYFDVGMNYWPHQNVVLKCDVQFTDLADSSKDEEIINLGVGYQF